jgi:hypothetical protein
VFSVLSEILRNHPKFTFKLFSTKSPISKLRKILLSDILFLFFLFIFCKMEKMTVKDKYLILNCLYFSAQSNLNLHYKRYYMKRKEGKFRLFLFFNFILYDMFPFYLFLYLKERRYKGIKVYISIRLRYSI